MLTEAMAPKIIPKDNIDVIHDKFVAKNSQYYLKYK